MTGWMESLHFLRPQLLWLLLLAPLIGAGWRLRQRWANVWRQAVDAHLLPHLLAGAGRAGWIAPILLVLGFAMAIVALAGPSWRQGDQPLWEQRAPLVIALDLSSAVEAADLPPSRLLQARGKLAALLRQRQGGQVALVAYAGDAFTVAPLTEDADNIALFLDALSPDVMPVDGQRTDRAIDWSARLLKQAGFDRGEILLMADHADAAALEAAARASRQGYRVSVLGLGSEAGAAYRARDGALARTRLDAASLRQLAQRGGGRFETLAREGTDLEALGVLAPDSIDAASPSGARGKAWLDEGYWLLPPLMLLMLLAFRRGTALMLLAVCSLLWALPSQAADGNWWRRADQLQHARIEQGVQAYRKGDFASAEQAFAGQDNAEAYYNLGNALAKQGRYDEAIGAYDRALQRQPGMQDAIANRRAVEQARQRQQGQGQGQQGKNSPDRGAGNAGASPNASRAASNAAASQQQGQQPPATPEKPPSRQQADSAQSPARTASQSPDSPADPQAQQAADAAQRERMRQALARQSEKRDGKASTGQAAAEETPAERERRQALQAWLKRVPDDPGGLLKAKFQLEHERRTREGQ
ncbi:VWA domain-containing protein [Pseudomonas sp. R2.Fl]|nr:VWA domain-containing protein [Pseudomonas sp. R2.Fl]